MDSEQASTSSEGAQDSWVTGSEARSAYDDRLVQVFLLASCGWGVIASLLVGLTSVSLVQPYWIQSVAPQLTFNHIRPAFWHISLLGFAANVLFTAVYFSTQRLCRRSMWSRPLGILHCVLWQSACVWALTTLVRGQWQHREYWQLAWPIQGVLLLAWSCFAANFLMTVFKRRQQHLYVSLWFYIAAVIAVIPIQICGNLVLPGAGYNSHSWLPPVQDVFLQFWAAHSLQVYLLVLPFLGAMYYFLPKVTGRPIPHYRWVVIQFWMLTVLGVLVGSRSLAYAPVPDWLTSIGMLAGLLLLLPSWAAVTDGLSMLRHSAAEQTSDGSSDANTTLIEASQATRAAVLRFFWVALLCFAWVTLESGLLSMKSWGAIINLSDWVPARHLALTFGWAGCLGCGVMYWIVPQILRTEWSNKAWIDVHFWLAAGGTAMLISATYMSGWIQGAMAASLDGIGTLVYPEFIEIVQAAKFWWWLQACGAAFLAMGMLLQCVNAVLTWPKREKSKLPRGLVMLPPLEPEHVEVPESHSDLAGKPVLQLGVRLDVWSQLGWHRRWERSPLRFTCLVALAILLGCALYVVPTIWSGLRDGPEIQASARLYTPLELAGRQIYLREGCAQCHTQTVRPIVAETKRYGDFNLPGDYSADEPALWGSRRIGPDLGREAGKQNGYWHWQHLADPQLVNPGSVMPRFPELLTRKLELDQIKTWLHAAIDQGFAYDESWLEEVEMSEEDRWAGELTPLEELLQTQAEQVAADIVRSGGPAAMMDREATALIAYLQRLGAPPAPVESSP